MGPDDLKRRARRIPDEMLTQGDLAVADELIAPACRYQAPHAEGSGIDGAKAWVAALRRAFPDLRAIVEDEVAEGDAVCLRLALGGTHDAAYAGVASSGRHVAWQLIAFLRAGADGRFAEMWCLWDDLALRRQLAADSSAATAEVP